MAENPNEIAVLLGLPWLREVARQKMSEEDKLQSQSGYFWSSMTGTVVNIDHQDGGLEKRLGEGLPAMNEKAWQMVMSLFGGQPQI
jgi:hypothetical protein